jgi:hypothetical protein
MEVRTVRAFIPLLIPLALGAALSSQSGEAPRFAQPAPMPIDRIKDSYSIYSQLLKSGPIEWRHSTRKQWLIEETTSAMPLDVSCGSVADHPGMNRHTGGIEPHTAVQAPADRKVQWLELLTDYDQHCHDVIQLNRQNFQTELPVHLLNAEDKRNLMNNGRQPPAEFADGAGLHRFSEVFFNADHTLALVEQGMWCAGLCGNWTWVVLERKGDQWQILPWVSTSMIS